MKLKKQKAEVFDHIANVTATLLRLGDPNTELRTVDRIILAMQHLSSNVAELSQAMYAHNEILKAAAERDRVEGVRVRSRRKS